MYKLKQSLWALFCSAINRKGALLTEYVNNVYWGRRYYGLDEAAKGYFNTTRGSLGPAQSFFLAERIATPNAISPRRIANLIERGPIKNSLEQDRATVLDVMSLYQQVYGCGGGLCPIPAK